VRFGSSLAIIGIFLPLVSGGQSVQSDPRSAGFIIETTPLPSATTLKITEIPLRWI
jgi:hypothetical protein